LTSAARENGLSNGREERAMSSWKEERDRLVAQTLAFVQQVAAVHPAKARPSVIQPGAAPAPATLPLAEQAVSPSDLPAATSPILPSGTGDLPSHLAPRGAADPGAALYITPSMRNDILRHVASFKARQNKVAREREAYYEMMQARIQKSLGNESDGARL
jgi:hypothetical protein